MPSAGLTGLYTLPPKSKSKDPFRDLHTQDIKSLVAILSSYPSKPDNEYWTDVRNASKDLPPTSAPPDSTSPFLTHFPLPPTQHHSTRTHPLPRTTLRSELEHGIGHFLYPIIMFAGLPAHLELKVRQLEPVLQMWIPAYNHADHVPKNRQPLSCSIRKWEFQGDGCPACILARLNSDEDVLFALLAGLVGRHKRKVVGTRDEVRSKRVKWVRYALKRFENGEKLVEEAWDLGEELKRVRKAWKSFGRESVSGSRKNGFYGGWMGRGERKSKIGTLTVGLQVPEGECYLPGVLYPPLRSTSTGQSLSPDIHYISPPSSPHQLPTAVVPRRAQLEVRTVPAIRAEIYNRPQSSIGSEQAQVDDTDDSEFEWETGSVVSDYSSTASERETHNHRMHLYQSSLAPKPLQTPSNSSMRSDTSPGEEFLKLNKRDQRSKYADFLDEPYVITPDASLPAPRSLGASYRDLISRDEAERMSRLTAWNALNR